MSDNTRYHDVPTSLTDPKQVPENMSEAEARDFWQTHSVTDEYLAKSEVDESKLPPTRPRKASRHTSIRLDKDTVERLRVLSERKGKGYQTLIKEFIAERLYEEEKREGVLR